jgi:peptidoglycan/xylan/chitin deacetylase (PgdA/CDA1 family)
MHFARTPFLIKKLYHSGAVWTMPCVNKKVYLTFDDGPVPEATPFVLETFAKFNAKATFFCVGENVSKHPELYKEIIASGHSVGNHTYNHLKGWKTSCDEYLENVALCSDVVTSDLFRPPYGRITKQQGRLLGKNFKLIFWTVLSGDYDAAVSPEMCYNNVVNNLEPGAIIVFHDSIKAFKNMSDCLPRVLSYCAEQGYELTSIPQSAQCEVKNEMNLKLVNEL